MKYSDAKVIVNALDLIKGVLKDHSDDIYESVCVDYDTDSGENFYISVLEEFLEIGLPYTIQYSGAKSFPYELISDLDGIEIRTWCELDDLKRCNITALLPEIPDES